MHIIRLRGPWEVAPLEPRTAASLRLMLPGDWRAPVGDYAGRVQFRRRFHRPSGLSDTSRVQLAVSGLPAERIVSCNEKLLFSGDDPDRYDLTHHLTPQNLLVVELTLAPVVPLAGEIWLEISEPESQPPAPQKSASS